VPAFGRIYSIPYQSDKRWFRIPGMCLWWQASRSSWLPAEDPLKIQALFSPIRSGGCSRLYSVPKILLQRLDFFSKLAIGVCSPFGHDEICEK